MLSGLSLLIYYIYYYNAVRIKMNTWMISYSYSSQYGNSKYNNDIFYLFYFIYFFIFNLNYVKKNHPKIHYCHFLCVLLTFHFCWPSATSPTLSHQVSVSTEAFVSHWVSQRKAVWLWSASCHFSYISSSFRQLASICTVGWKHLYCGHLLLAMAVIFLTQGMPTIPCIHRTVYVSP